MNYRMGMSNLTIGMSFIVCSFIYMLLLCVVYFSKKRIKTTETGIYSQLLVLNVIGLLLEFLCCFAVKNMDNYPIHNIVANRLYLVYFATFVSLFTAYVYIACSKASEIDKNEIVNFNTREKLIIFGTYIVLLLAVLLLPLQYHNEADAVYSFGPATDALTVACGFYMLIDILNIIINRKKLNKKKLIPMIALLICFTLAFIVRTLNPGIILII